MRPRPSDPMRPLLACVVLLLAGCAQAPAPPATPEPAKPTPEPDWGPTVRDGPWTLRVAPRLLQGAPGEEIRFTAEVRHDGLPPPGSVVEPSGFFAWLDGTASRSVPLTEQTTHVTGRILAGSDASLQLQVLVHGGGVRSYYLRAGALLGGENVTLVPVPVEKLPGAGTTGLSARQEEGRRVNATFSFAPEPQRCPKPEAATDFLLVRREGRQELWGFVKELVYAGYPCPDGWFDRRALRALTPELAPGELAVRVYSTPWCQCPPTVSQLRVAVD